MLVLTAKRDDRIKIGDNIEILIIYTADSRVRIGIEAPEALRIERKPKNETGAGPAEAGVAGATNPPAAPPAGSAATPPGNNGAQEAAPADRPNVEKRVPDRTAE